MSIGASGLTKLLAASDSRTMLQTVLDSPYVPITPTEKQAEALADLALEQLYGGAAGGGKSECLLAAALAFVEVPGYSAIVFRRTHTDLALAGALMDRSHEWLANTPARWNQQNKVWRFPSGSTLQFGYLDHDRAKFRYQSAEFQFIGFDELTQFPESNYTYLFSRLRKKAGMPVPMRMRGASNPGGVGHDWVKARFLPEGDAAVKSVLAGARYVQQVGEGVARSFLPAGVVDNPHIDLTAYVRNLEQLDPLTRAQLLKGDWTARNPGAIFRREWFRVVDDYPGYTGSDPVRYWDLAATEYTGQSDPDWTAGVKMLRDDFGNFWVLDVKRCRKPPHEVERLVLDTAEDEPRARVRMMQDPGQAGKHQIAVYARRLVGHRFEGVLESGSKFVRAQPFASQVGAGNVYVLNRPWTSAFLDELEAFQEEEDQYAHDDQVDAVSGAFGVLAEEVRRRVRRGVKKSSSYEGVPDELLKNTKEGQRRAKRRLPKVYE